MPCRVLAIACTRLSSTDRERIMITKTTYIAKRSASLNALDQEIIRLTDYANNATADVANTYFAVIRDLQAKRDKAATMLCQMHSGHDISWKQESATTGVEDAWNELRDAVLAAITTTYYDARRQTSKPHRFDGPHRIRRNAPRGSSD
jgi:hypothetical protein